MVKRPNNAAKQDINKFGPSRAKPFIRLAQVLEIIPMTKSTWYDGIKNGLHPPAIRVGKRAECWNRTSVLALLATKVS